MQEVLPTEKGGFGYNQRP